MFADTFDPRLKGLKVSDPLAGGEEVSEASYLRMNFRRQLSCGKKKKQKKNHRL